MSAHRAVPVDDQVVLLWQVNDMVDEDGRLKGGDEDHEEGGWVAVELVHVGEGSDKSLDAGFLLRRRYGHYQV